MFSAEQSLFNVKAQLRAVTSGRDVARGQAAAVDVAILAVNERISHLSAQLHGNNAGMPQAALSDVEKVRPRL